MNKLINGKKIAKRIEDKAKEKIEQLKQKGIKPRLGVIFIGDDKASKTYIRKKKEKAKELGIGFDLFQYSKGEEVSKIKEKVRKIQSEKNLTGLIVQLPVPNKFYPQILDWVKPEYDVDCLTSTNIGKLVKNKPKVVPPTPAAVMEVLKEINVNLKGKNVTIVGTGILVGKPLAVLMMNNLASVQTCNIETKSLEDKCKKADIIVSAVGKKGLIKSDMVKKGAIVIDTGIDYEGKKMHGDVEPEVEKKASYMTPTPGGIGPVTVSKLFYNVVKCCS